MSCRFFLSEGYFTRQMLPEHFGFSSSQGGMYRGKELIYCRPVGVHPKIEAIIDARIRSVLACEKAPEPGQTCLFLAAHGTEQNPHSAQFALAQAGRLSQKGVFGEVQTIFLDQAPYIRDWRTLTDREQIAVIPLFLSDGLHVTDDIPELLGFKDNSDVAEFTLMAVGESSTPREGGKMNIPQFMMRKRLFGAKDLIVAKVENRTIWYARSLGREPMLANVILDLCLD